MDDTREYLISIIEWYRDEWNPQNKDYYNDMLQEVMRATTEHALECISCVVDGWLD